MKCRHCNSSNTIKYGHQQNGKVRHHCKSCFRYFQESYRYQSSITEDKAIIVLTKESCGIRSISRILNISSSTVIRRTKKIANGLARPYPIVKGKCYEVDELFTYVGHKKGSVPDLLKDEICLINHLFFRW